MLFSDSKYNASILFCNIYIYIRWSVCLPVVLLQKSQNRPKRAFSGPVMPCCQPKAELWHFGMCRPQAGLHNSVLKISTPQTLYYTTHYTTSLLPIHCTELHTNIELQKFLYSESLATFLAKLLSLGNLPMYLSCCKILIGQF